MMIIPPGNITALKGSLIAPLGTEVEVILGWNTLIIHSQKVHRQKGQDVNQVTKQWFVLSVFLDMKLYPPELGLSFPSIFWYYNASLFSRKNI